MEKQMKKSKTDGAGLRSRIKKRFTAKRVALMATFVALSLLISVIDFPIFPSLPFLELDFGNVFILLIGFLLGPIEGVIVCVLKEVLHIPVGTTGGVGEFANIVVTISYILVPCIVYQYKKGLPCVVACLGIAGVFGTAMALLSNRFVMFPLFLGEKARGAFQGGFWLILAFNLIKTTAISVLTLLLYKRLSNFLKKNKNSIALPDKICYNKDMKPFISTSREETLAFARAYAKTLKPGDIVLLGGDMGAGKTVFAKGVAEGLGIQEEVTSPTYAYMNDYDGVLFHYDCYRIEDVAQAEALGLADYFYMGGICLIEWAQNISPLLPKYCKRVDIIKLDENRREIRQKDSE